MTCPCDTCQNRAPKFDEAPSRLCSYCEADIDPDQSDYRCSDCFNADQEDNRRWSQEKRNKLIDQIFGGVR